MAGSSSLEPHEILNSGDVTVSPPNPDLVVNLECEPCDPNEGRKIKGMKPVQQPTKEEYDDHMRTHIPYRQWCEICVKGRKKNPSHTTKHDDLEKD